MSVPMSNPPGATPVPNYFTWALVSTILGFCLCCPSVISGVVSIVYSNKVNTLLAQGDVDGARQASNTAKTWCIVTSVLAAIGLLTNIAWVATGGIGQYQEMLQQMQHMR